MSITENNRRIAKNTLYLYMQMILLLVVSLYSARVILDVLGAADYGTYNVVGGVITTLSFITGSLAGATSRFITFEMGRGNIGSVEKVFRCSITIYYIFSAIIFILAESIGLWFINSYLTIPAGREIAALVVYQCSVITFIISIISIPYTALIIAHERMNAFAYISIYEGISKLIILFIIPIVEGDKLIWYAVLLMIMQLSVRLIYNIYCSRNFKECNSKWYWNKNLFLEMFSYSWWNMNGYLAMVGYTQGLNILLNIYFGPIVNAARAISVQVQSTLEQFFGNVTMAIKPQVIKQYAQGNIEYMHNLMLRAGRLSFMMAIFVAVPLFVFTDYVLYIWLVNPPEHTANFVRLMLIAGVSSSLKQHTIMAIHATGDIKKFQIVEGTFLLMVLPVSYILLKYFSVNAESVLLCYVVIEIVSEFLRVFLVYPKVNLPIKFFFTKVLFSCLTVSIVIAIPSYFIYYYVVPSNFLVFLLACLALAIVELLSIYFFGLDAQEKDAVVSYVRKILYKSK